MTKECPNCHKKVFSSDSIPIARGRHWTVSQHFFCSCDLCGELWIGHGKMHGKEKMVWDNSKVKV